MTEDTLLPFDLPAVSRKKVTADFAGGSISSDGGLVLLRAAERRLGLAEALAGCIREWRDPERVVHTLPAMLRFRMFAIACGYEDADDCDALRGDPLFKLAVGRAGAAWSSDHVRIYAGGGRSNAHSYRNLGEGARHRPLLPGRHVRHHILVPPRIKRTSSSALDETQRGLKIHDRVAFAKQLN